jgi:hypothetical protein
MDEVVEKGRVVQQSEDPWILIVEYDMQFPLLGVNVDLFVLLPIPYCSVQFTCCIEGYYLNPLYLLVCDEKKNSLIFY